MNSGTKIDDKNPSAVNALQEFWEIIQCLVLETNE